MKSNGRGLVPNLSSYLFLERVDVTERQSKHDRLPYNLERVHRFAIGDSQMMSPVPIFLDRSRALTRLVRESPNRIARTLGLPCMLLALFASPAAAKGLGCHTTVTPNHRDDSRAITEAIARCPNVHLGAGIFHISRPIHLLGRPDGLTIRGAGRGITVLHSTIGWPKTKGVTDVRYSVLLSWDPYVRKKRSIVGRIQSGKRELSVDSIAGLKPGDSVLLSTNGKDSASELHRIASISGTMLTLAEPVQRTYPVEGTKTRVWKATRTRNLRISDLTISGNAMVGIEVPAAESCLIERVEVGNASSAPYQGPWRGKIGIYFDNAGIGNAIRDCSVTATKPDPGDGTLWGFSLESQDNSTIENCTATNAADGFSVNYSRNIAILNVRAQRCTVGLIINRDDYGEPSQNVTVQSSQFNGGNTGILVQPGCVDFDITDVENNQNSENGIDIRAEARRFVVERVTSEKNGAWGMAVQASQCLRGNIDGIVRDCRGGPSRLGRVGGAVHRLALDASCSPP